MADDWQDTLRNSRHSHNRTHKSAGRGKARGKAEFTPTSAFGSYSITCKKLRSQDGSPTEDGAFEIMNLTQCGRGFHVELDFGEALSARGIMAPSRKILAAIRSEDNDDDDEGSGGDERESDSEESNEDDDSEDNENGTSVFEKNTFRVPKFWLGLDFSISQHEVAGGKDLGYIVFSHNDCRKFKGTLNCQALSWDNVPVQGRKITSRPARDPVAVV